MPAPRCNGDATAGLAIGQGGQCRCKARGVNHLARFYALNVCMNGHTKNAAGCCIGIRRRFSCQDRGADKRVAG